jgi:hypothetical protein
MPRPDQVPLPRAGEEAERGTTAALGRALSVTGGPDFTEEEAEFEAVDFTFAPPAEEEGEEPFTQELAPPQVLGDGLDEFVFGPTSRPGEPVTQGASFGAGTSFIPRPDEDDETFLDRVARELESSPSATQSVRDFARRIQRGE